MTATILDEQAVQSFEIQKQIDINASLEISFESLLEELGPESVMPDGKPFPLKLEPWPGGRWFRDLGNNAGHFWGHVQVIKPPTLLEICGPMPMSYPAINHVQWRLTAKGNGTQLKIMHKGMGLIIPEHRDGMPEGWEHGLERVREIAERKAAGGRAKR
jgi:uncharacterized protein YndB with AHSA1/START domain